MAEIVHESTVAQEAKAEAAVKRLRESYVDLARTYIGVAESFTTGSNGWIGNMREAAKYCNLAAGVGI
jgi:hypothetical protein